MSLAQGFRGSVCGGLSPWLWAPGEQSMGQWAWGAPFLAAWTRGEEVQKGWQGGPQWPALQPDPACPSPSSRPLSTSSSPPHTGALGPPHSRALPGERGARQVLLRARRGGGPRGHRGVAGPGGRLPGGWLEGAGGVGAVRSRSPPRGSGAGLQAGVRALGSHSGLQLPPRCFLGGLGLPSLQRLSLQDGVGLAPLGCPGLNEVLPRRRQARGQRQVRHSGRLRPQEKASATFY